MGACLTCFKSRRGEGGGKDIDDSPSSLVRGNKRGGRKGKEQDQRVRLLDEADLDSSTASSTYSKRFRIVKGKKKIWSGASAAGGSVANESALESVDENSALLENEPFVKRHEGSFRESSQSVQSSFISSVSSATAGKKKDKNNVGVSASREEPKRWSPAPSQRSMSSSSSQLDIAQWPSDPSDMTVEDELLLEAFYQSMKKGISLVLHKIGKNKLKRKTIRLWLEGFTIKWEIKGMMMNTKGTIQLTIIKRILYGKHSAIFQREENKHLKDSLCFTMVTRDYTIDFECASELERNAIARGFTILISHLAEIEES